MKESQLPAAWKPRKASPKKPIEVVSATIVSGARPEYHKSSIELFMKCGKAFEFRYIHGLKTPPRAALTVGQSFHTAVAHNLAQKTKSGTDLGMEEVLDSFSSDFDRRLSETDWGEDNPDVEKDAGAACVRAYHKEVAPKVKPVAVEERFVIETDADYDLGGTIDVIEENTIIRDHKSSNKKWADDAIFRAVEPALYDFAFTAVHGKKSKGFVYDVVQKPTKTIDARVWPVEGKVTKQDHQWLFETVDVMHRSIKAGVFMPASDKGWWCNKQWCGYWSQCKGKKR